MQDRVLSTLEFNKIISILSGFASSVYGKEEIDSLRPVSDTDIIRQWLCETDEAVRMILSKSNPSMGGIHDIRPAVRRIEIGSTLNPEELLHIADFLRVCRQLRNYVDDKNDREKYRTIVPMLESLAANKKIEDRIYTCIVNEEEISDRASTALYNIRRQIRELQSSIKDRLNSVIHSQKYQKFLQDSLVTIREDRYVIPVKSEYRNEISGLIHDSSASGSTLYIEPMAVVEANNDIKQAKMKEKNEIQRILDELSDEVRTIIPELTSNIGLITRLDFIFAKAKFSVEYGCVMPRINESGYINIKKGRHPLIERDKVVPIDIWIGEKFRTLVVTGPNTGGKTVALKTVGLFTLMMQSGIHVPAGDGTELSVFENIFADIGDEQSIEQSLSTFSAHMVNIVKILEGINSSSLVLLDELGAGTDPTEGSALAISILEYLKNAGACTIATTHYNELKLYAVKNEDTENASCEFDVATLRPTYRLLIGIPGKSNAFAISERLGLGKDIIENARTYLSNENIRFEDIIKSIEDNKKAAEEEKIRAANMRKEIEELRNELREKEEKLQEQKNKIISEAKQKAGEILESVKKEADAIASEIRKVHEQAGEADANRMIEQHRRKIKNLSDDLKSDGDGEKEKGRRYSTRPEELKPGTEVYVSNLDCEGTVIDQPNENGDVLVQVGILKITAKTHELKILKSDKSASGNERTGIGQIRVSKSHSISAEIDLRGQIIDEAIVNVDKYLDDAYLSGIKTVTIIHGKGTGALREGVQSFLRTHSHVKSFRLGKYGEGESGVTIVELK